MTIILYGRAESPDMYYRCGWKSDVKCLLIDDGETPILYVPGFEYLRAKAETTGIEVRKLTNPKEHLSRISGEVTTDLDFPHVLARHVQAEFSFKREVYEQRYSKSAEEIQKIEHAQRLTQQAIDIVRTLLESCELIDGVAHVQGEPLTAEQCKIAARAYLISHDADCKDLIVASGEQTGQPHNRGSGPLVQGPVIIDIFAQTADGYHGDCTRTFILGEDQDADKLLAAVKDAHDQCIKKCVPGQSISELYELAKKIMTKHGFETDDEHGFIHSLGHGVGLDIHESPNLSPKSEDVLKQGMAITIEPGLYYATGVRHENLVLVGEKPRIIGKP